MRAPRMSDRTIAPLPYSEEWWRVTLSSIGDGVIVTEATAKISFMNPVAETLTGWTDADANQKPLEEVFRIFNENDRTPLANSAIQVLASGEAATHRDQTLLVSRKGTEFTIADS